MDTPDVLLQLLSDGGILAGCILLIWLLATEKLVPRSRLNEQRQERLADEERSRAAMQASLNHLQALTDALVAHNQRTVELVIRLEAVEHAIGRKSPPRPPDITLPPSPTPPTME